MVASDPATRVEVRVTAPGRDPADDAELLAYAERRDGVWLVCDRDGHRVAVTSLVEVIERLVGLCLVTCRVCGEAVERTGVAGDGGWRHVIPPATSHPASAGWS